jgi:prepilin-type N-terminal cleavage/methylation domain-containing protein
MKTQIKKIVKKITKSQAGFTLAELLVVVAIIVGLAAVILPNIGRFTGKGAEGAQSAELQSIQTAIDTYMADNGLATVTANGSGQPAENDLLNAPLDLTGYLRLPGGATLTSEYYCWDQFGTIIEQRTTAGNCA